MRVIIDHESYGVLTVFENLDEAQSQIRDCGGDFSDTTFYLSGTDVIDDRNEIVGRLETP